MKIAQEKRREVLLFKNSYRDEPEIKIPLNRATFNQHHIYTEFETFSPQVTQEKIIELFQEAVGKRTSYTILDQNWLSTDTGYLLKLTKKGENDKKLNVPNVPKSDEEREIERLKKENEKLKIENESVKMENEKLKKAVKDQNDNDDSNLQAENDKIQELRVFLGGCSVAPPRGYGGAQI